MKRSTPLEIFKMPVPAEPMVGLMTNKTPIARATGRLALSCPVCESLFSRPAAWVRRADNSYCSRACAWAAKVTQIERPCIICTRPMLIQPSLVNRKLTCSQVCSSERKRSRGVSSRVGNWAAYKQAAQAMREKGACHRCSTNNGPWVVRGLQVSAPDGSLPVCDSSKAELICVRCHFKEVGSIGAANGHQRRKAAAETRA